MIDVLKDLGESVARVKINNLNGKLAIDGDDVEQIDFVLLDVTVTRVLWEPGVKYTGKEKPLCRSNDGENPEPGGSQPGPCAKCPCSQWVREQGKITPPTCTQVYNLKGYNMADGRVFIFGVKSSGVKKLRELNQLLNMRKAKVALRNEWKHLGVALRLTTIQEINLEKKNRYYIPSFQATGLVDDSVLDNLLIYVGAPDDVRITKKAVPPVMAMPTLPDEEPPVYSAKGTVDLGEGLTGKLVSSSKARRAKSQAANAARAAETDVAVMEEGEEAPF